MATCHYHKGPGVASPEQSLNRNRLPTLSRPCSCSEPRSERLPSRPVCSPTLVVSVVPVESMVSVSWCLVLYPHVPALFLPPHAPTPPHHLHNTVLWVC